MHTLERRVAIPGYAWKAPFWEQPLEKWDEMHLVGVRSNCVASAMAARTMPHQGSGLVVSISFHAGRRYCGNVLVRPARSRYVGHRCILGDPAC